LTDKSIKELVEVAFQAIEDKKALEPLVLDIASVSIVADYFIICSGRTDIQVRAIAGEVEERLAIEGSRPRRAEGISEGLWVLLDYSDFVVHIFRQTEREYYNLERLWADAKQVVELGS
jgi:ribosome-associated protein